MVNGCEGALFEAGTFERAYNINQAVGLEDALDADPVASAIRAFMAEQERDANGGGSGLAPPRNC